MNRTLARIVRLLLFIMLFNLLVVDYGQIYAENVKEKKPPRHQVELIVKYKNPAKEEEVKSSLRQDLKLDKLDSRKKHRRSNMEVLEIGSQDSMAAVLKELKQDPNVLFAQPNYELKTTALPADERFDELWGLSNNGQAIAAQTGTSGVDLQALKAWATTQGSPSVVIGVLDTGIDLTHPDLAANIYVNPGEIPNNGIDDDGNGYIDDVNGWDFASKDNSIFDSAAADKHGTHVAGIIAASANEIGVRGVAPGVTLLPLKFMSGQTGYTSDALEAIEYAKQAGVKIINASFGSTTANPALEEAIRQSGILFVSGAGNNGADSAKAPVYPAAFALPNVLSVAALDNQGKLLATSNYGGNVDVAAPGAAILSTVPGETYGYLSGTSMASAYVAGVAGLILSQFPDMDAVQLAQRVQSATTPLAALKGKVKTGGLVNASLAVQALEGSAPEDEASGGPAPTEQEEMVVALAAQIDPALQEQIHYGEDGVSVTTGNYAKSVTDFSMPAPGFTVNVSRTYNAKDDRPTSSMGRGWTFSFEGSLKVNPSNSSQMIAKLPNGSSQIFIKNGNDYTANDSHSKLVKATDNSHTLTTTDQYSYGFNAAGYLVWMKDPTGNAVTMTVDGSGKISQITDAVNRSFTVNYNGTYIKEVVDPLNRKVVYDYDSSNRLVKVTAPSGRVIAQYAYDSSGYLTTLKDGEGNILEGIVYNHAAGVNQHKVTKYTDRFGNVETFTYDSANRKTTIVDSNGRTLIKKYDTALYVTESQDPEGKVTKVEYYTDATGFNKFGEEKSIIDRLGNKTEYVRDANGNMIKIINPDSSFREYGYDDRNHLIWERDELGKTIYSIYTPGSNQLQKTVKPLNGTDAYTGDSEAFAITAYAYYSAAETKAFGMNVSGLLKSTTDPEGHITTYRYDKYGQVNETIDAAGNRTVKQYNAIGWLTSTISAEGYRTDYAYDPDGNLLRETDHEGGATRTVYDTLGRIVQVVDPNAYVANQDALNDAVPGTAYRGTTSGTRTTYYANGMKKSVTDALGNVATYAYDLYGNLLQEIKPNQSEYVYQYDEMNRLKKTSFKADAKAVPVLLKAYTYEALSGGQSRTIETRYLNETETAVTTTLTDTRGRVVSTEAANGATVQTLYLANGLVQAVTDGRGNTTTYRYDGLNRLSEQWSPLDAGKFSYKRIDYDLNNRKLKELTGIDPVKLFGRPVEDRLSTLTYTYTALGQVEQMTNPIGGKTISHYDGDGRVTRQEQVVGKNETYATAFAYNHKGQLVSEIREVQGGDLDGMKPTDRSTVKLETSYVYDANGNKKSVTTPDGNQTSFTYDLLNRQLSSKQTGTNEQGQAVVKTISQTYDWAGQVLTTTDALQNVTTYRYDERGLLQHMENAAGGITAYSYDRAGRKVTEISPKNFDAAKKQSELSRTEYVYDAMDRVLAVTEKFEEKYVNPTSFQWETRWMEVVSKAYAYDENGNVIKELDGMGVAAGAGKTVQERIQSGYGTVTRYNAANLPTLVLDAASKEQGLKHTRLLSYDGLGRNVTVTDAAGAVTQTYYDAAGNQLATSIRKTASSPEQVLQTRTYNSAGQLVTETDPYGHQTVNVYNAFGQIRQTTDSGSESVPAYTLTRQYDGMGRVAKEWDNQNEVTKWTYDAEGRTLTTTKEDSQGKQRISTKSAYDLNGNLRFETDGNGNTTEYQYDQLNRSWKKTVKVTDMVIGQRALSTTYAYDQNGNLLLERNAFGQELSFRYDSLNRLIEKRDAKDVVIAKLEYNANNAQIRAWDALNRLTQYRYDKNNRQVMTIDPLGYRTATLYNGVGQVERQTDGKGNETSYAYDYFNRLIEVSNALSEKTTYTYDLNGNKLTQTDGNGHTISFEYTAASLMTKRIDHEGKSTSPTGTAYEAGKVESYTYYPNGQMKSKTDRNGNTTTYTYDVHRRVTAQTVEGASVSRTPLAERQITYTYDGNGNQLTMTDGTGTTSRSYDELNQVVSKSVPQLGTSTFRYAITAGLTSGYTSEITKDVKGNVTTKVFDQTNRLAEVRSNSDQPIVYSYYADGSRQQVEYAGGVKETYTYTGNNQLQELKNWKGTTLLDTYTYTYDAAGNQKTKNERVNGTNKGTTTYTYDVLNRLQQVQEPGGKVTSYRFDAAGNRTEEKVTAGSVVSIVNYEYNEQNRLMKTTDTKTSGETQVDQYRYDANGNMIHKSREVTKLFNPLAPVEPTFGMFIEGQPNENPRINDIVSGTESFEYDVWNQLVKTSNGNGTATYAYNGEGYRTKKTTNGQTTLYLYEYDKVVLETDGTGKQLARNVYGLNLLTREVGSEKYAYLYNGHGDVTALLDTAGVIKATYAYDAFGNITESTGAVQNPIRYAGYQYDEESSLYYLNARYYDPKIARFLSEDTYRGSDFDPLSLNYYTYTHNEPMMYIDPSGHTDVQLRQLAEAAGATITYNSKTQTATVTLVSGYSVDFSTSIRDENNKKIVTIKDGRMIIDNEKFDQMMSGSRSTQISQNSSTITTRTTTASIDSAVAGTNVAVVTQVIQTTEEKRKYSPGPPLKKQITTLRSSTVVFNKDTDEILNRYPVTEYPQFMNTSSNNASFTPAQKALIWEALTNDTTNRSNFLTDEELRVLVNSKMFKSMSIAEFYRGYTESAYSAYKQGVSIGELLGTSYLQQASQPQQAVLLTALKVGTKLPGAARASSGCNCFTAGTKVLTDEGEKNIEDIEVGDRVLSKNEETGEVAYKEVTATFNHETDEIYKIHVGGQTIESTFNHPFYVQGKGWTFVKDLKVGDLLVQSDGNTLKIESIELEHKQVTVYNMTVDEFHTYFVSDLGIWVHNTGTCSINDLPDHVQSSYKKYDKNGWKGNVAGYTQGTKAGAKYENSNGALPTTDANGKPITYKEFDVNNKQPGARRDAERFVVGSDGSIYYTDSHYGEAVSPTGLPAFVKVN